MRPAPPDARRLARSILALALGAATGAAAWQAGLPLPWMLGPMIGTTIAALAGVPLAGPDRIRPMVIPVIGVMLGSGITADLFGHVTDWGGTFVAIAPFLAVAAALSYVFYRRVGHYDEVTAFFSAMPGGLNDMLIMGVARGGVEKRIALAHATRILVVISFVVLFFGAFLGVRSGGATANWIPLGALTALDWAVLGGAAAGGLAIGTRIGLPAAPIMGPMLLSGAAHASGLVTVSPPSLLVILAQIVIGTVIGCRFLGTTPREVGRDLMLGAGSSLLMILVAVSFAVAVHFATGTELSQVFLAFSPGGLSEMGLLAVAMGQDIAYVSVMHLARILLVIFAAIPVFRLLRKG